MRKNSLAQELSKDSPFLDLILTLSDDISKIAFGDVDIVEIGRELGELLFNETQLSPDLLIMGLTSKNGPKVEEYPEIIKIRGGLERAIGHKPNFETIRAFLGDRLEIEPHIAFLPKPFFSDPLIKNFQSGLKFGIFAKGQMLAYCIMAWATKKELSMGHIKSLEIIINQMALALHHGKCYEDDLKGCLVEKELEVAHSIQKKLLPKAVPGIIGLDIAAMNRAAKTVSGDYYDFINHNDENWAFVIADVSGHGVPAALIMTLARTVLRSTAKKNDDPGKILTLVNRLLLEDMEGLRYVTMVYGVFCTVDRTFRFVRAGHVPPILYSAKTGDCTFLDNPGFFLGIFDEGHYETQTISLDNGDRLIFYTDGLCDARDPKGQEYGIDRLKWLVQENREKNSKDLLELIDKDILDFTASSVPRDDLTLMILTVGDNKGTVHKDFPSERQSVTELVSMIWDAMLKLGIEDESQLFQVRLIADELMTNAIQHGNRKYGGKKIYTSFRVNEKGLELTVKDEGDGFDWPTLFDSISDRMGMLLPRGRGILITREISQKLIYNERGNQVYVFKKF